MSAVSLLIVAASLGAPAPPSDAEKALDELQGVWYAVAMEQKGEKIPEKEVKESAIVFTIKCNKLTVKNDDGKLDSYSIALDPKKSPPRIDLKELGEDAARGTCHAIYSVERGELRICLSTNFNPNKPEDRPKEFATVKGSEERPPKGKYLFVLKRQDK